MKTKKLLRGLQKYGFTRRAALDLLREGRALGKSNRQIYNFGCAASALDYAGVMLGCDHLALV